MKDKGKILCFLPILRNFFGEKQSLTCEASEKEIVFLAKEESKSVKKGVIKLRLDR
jgi:hypothetical protein